MAVNVPPEKPTPAELRLFAALQAAFFLLVGLALLKRELAPAAVYVMWGASAAAMLAGLARPSLVKGYYAGWMKLVSPIGWGVSHLLMAMVFFGVVTPMGWWRRNYLGDPLRRRIARERQSYWEQHPPPPDPSSYFRQF